MLSLGQDGGGVERFDGGGVDDGDVHVVRRQRLGGLQGAHGHQPAGDEDDVVAAAQHLGLAEFEGVVVFVQHGGNVAAQQPQVGGSFAGRELRDGLFDVDRVAGVHDGQVGHAAEDRHVLGGLVAGAVAGGQAGQPADDVDVQVRFGAVQAEEVVGAAGGEHGVGGGERHQAGFGQPGGGAEEQLFGHAHLEEPLREGLGEDVHVGVFAQVRGEADDFVVFLRGLDQGVPERGGGGFLAGIGEGRDHGRGLQLGGGALRLLWWRSSGGLSFVSCGQLLAAELPFVFFDAHEVRLLPVLQQRHAAADLGVAEDHGGASDGGGLGGCVVEGCQQRGRCRCRPPAGCTSRRLPTFR